MAKILKCQADEVLKCVLDFQKVGVGILGDNSCGFVEDFRCRNAAIVAEVKWRADLGDPCLARKSSQDGKWWN